MRRSSLWTHPLLLPVILSLSFCLQFPLPGAVSETVYEEKAFLPAVWCTSVDISPDGSTIYARTHFGDWNEGVRLYSGLTYEHIKDFENLPNVPWSILAGADGNHLYASYYYGGAVMKLDASTGEVVESISVGPWQVIYSTDFSTDPGWTTNSPDNFHWNQADGNYYFKRRNGSEQYSYRDISYDPGAAYRLEFDVCLTRCDWAASLFLSLSDPDMHIASATTWQVSYHRVDQGKTAALIFYDSEGGSYHPGGLQPAPFQLNLWYHNVAVYDPAAGSLSLRVTEVSDGSLVGEIELTDVGSFAGVDRLSISSVGHHYASGATVEGYIDNVVLTRDTGVPQAPLVTHFAINGGAASTEERVVTLGNVTMNSPTHFMASESAEFSGARWHAYSTGPQFTLSSGDGEKTVYFKTKNEAGESNVVSDTIVLQQAGWELVYSAHFSSDPGWTTNSPEDFYWNETEGNYHFKLVNGGEQYSYKSIPFDPSASYRLEFDVYMTRCDWAADLYLGLGDPDMDIGSATTWYVSYHKVDQGQTGSLIYYDSEGGSYHPGGLQPAPFQLNAWYHNVVTYDAEAGTLSLEVTKVSDGSLVGEVELTDVGSFAGVDRLYMSSVGHHYASGATAEGYIDNLVLKRSSEVTNLIVNGDFSGGLSGWTFSDESTALGSATAAVEEGELVVEGNLYYATGRVWQKFEALSPTRVAFDYGFPESAGINQCSRVKMELRQNGERKVDFSAWRDSLLGFDRFDLWVTGEGESWVVLQSPPEQGSVELVFDYELSEVIVKLDGVELTSFPVGSPEGLVCDGLSLSVHNSCSDGRNKVRGVFDNVLLEGVAAALQPPLVSQFAINGGADTTEERIVTLNNTTENGPRHYMASENPDFEGATWQTYSTAPEFTLSEGDGEKTVYFKTKNEAGESNVLGDTITLQETVWEVLYQTDFSSDPGWTTNDAANLSWDAETETFHAWQANTNTSYAYIPLELKTGASFRLEFDARINSVQWSAGLTFGLFDKRLMYNAGAVIEYSLVDAGYITALYAGNPSGPPDWEVSNWETGVWYHNVIEYDAASQTISFEARRRDNGELLSELTLSGISSFPPGMRFLGVSRLHMEGYNNSAADFDLDNIVLKEHYVPPKRPIAILPVSGPLLRITWDSEAASDYQLWTTSDLSSGEWEPLGPRMGGTGKKLYIDDYVDGIERRFYRVETISLSADN